MTATPVGGSQRDAEPGGEGGERGEAQRPYHVPQTETTGTAGNQRSARRDRPERDQLLTGLDRLALAHVDGLDDAGSLGGELVLHLHRLDDGDRRPGGHDVADA